MAERSSPPHHVALYQHVKRLAVGDHPLAKYASPLLLFLDALLCSLIISKVACELHLDQLEAYAKLMYNA